MPKDSPIHRSLTLTVVGVRIALGALLLWSGIQKVQYPYDFLSSVYDYELVGPKLGILVAIVLPWMEILIGCCLVIGLCVGGSTLVAAFLAASFVFVQSSALARGLQISCGCFGPSRALDAISYKSILGTILLFLAAAALVVFHFTRAWRESVYEVQASGP